MAQLSAIDMASLLEALHSVGFDIVKIGEVPDWMEHPGFRWLDKELDGPLYRVKAQRP